MVIMECTRKISGPRASRRRLGPGTKFEYTFLDVLGRPWAQIWEEYHEKGMTPPEKEDIFSFPGQWEEIGCYRSRL